MEKIGNKLNSLQELEIDIRLEVTLRNFSNDLKALINNLKAKKALQISMINQINHLIKKIKKSLNKFKVNFSVIYLIINYQNKIYRQI